MNDETADPQKNIEMQMLHKNTFIHAQIYPCELCKINCNGKIAVKVVYINIVMHGKKDELDPKLSRNTFFVAINRYRFKIIIKK